MYPTEYTNADSKIMNRFLLWSTVWVVSWVSYKVKEHLFQTLYVYLHKVAQYLRIEETQLGKYFLIPSIGSNPKNYRHNRLSESSEVADMVRDE